MSFLREASLSFCVSEQSFWILVSNQKHSVKAVILLQGVDLGKISGLGRTGEVSEFVFISG